MLLCADIGNTNINYGCYSGDELRMLERVYTDRNRTAVQYCVELRDILVLNGIDPSSIDGSIVGSVVPEACASVSAAIEMLTGKAPLIVGPGTKTGLDIRIDVPSETGADLVAAAVAVKAKYPLPCVIIDMGTATTLTAIDAAGCFIGGAILPGLKISLNALVGKTSLLPDIALSAPDRVICGSTSDCMISGIIYGTASMLDGMIAKFRTELGGSCSVVSTGGLSRQVTGYCTEKVIQDDNLVVDGLRLIYERNSRKK
ncbi:MAG: type III pantothenate kinase [Oscillospiraceae bacterium]|jgi:type III pantothenate kinase